MLSNVSANWAKLALHRVWPLMQDIPSLGLNILVAS